MIEIGDTVGIIISSDKDSVRVQYGVFEGLQLPQLPDGKYTSEFRRRRIEKQPKLVRPNGREILESNNFYYVGIENLKRYAGERKIITVE